MGLTEEGGKLDGRAQGGLDHRVGHFRPLRIIS